MKSGPFAFVCATLFSLLSANAAAQDARLFLVRVSSFIGLVNPYYVAIDGKDLVRIRSGERSEHVLPPGDYAIAVKCFGGFLPTWNTDSTRFSVKAGEDRYFLISPSMGCASIKPIEEADGKSRFAGAKPVAAEQVLGQVTAPPAAAKPVPVQEPAVEPPARAEPPQPAASQ